jgi:hypothetical protein
MEGAKSTQWTCRNIGIVGVFALHGPINLREKVVVGETTIKLQKYLGKQLQRRSRIRGRKRVYEVRID